MRNLKVNIMLSEYDKMQIENLHLKIKYLEGMLEPIIEKQFNKLMINHNRLDNQNRPLLDIGGIAKMFNVTKTTIHNWRRRGLIVGEKMLKGRFFTEQEVRDALKGGGWKSE